jgi:hypothetical protein
MIRTFCPAAVLLLAAAVPAAAQPSASTAWRTDLPCTAGRDAPLTVAPAAENAFVPGCVRAHCVALPDGRRVCSCTGDTAITVRVEAQGRTLHEWPADYGFAGSPEALRAITGDLDGDGRPELIVDALADMSNGLGIRYHEIRIFDGRDPSRAPTRVAVEDFDARGSFVRPAGGGDCRLIATRWTELREPRRGPGMYLVGQWMRYRDGRLEHDAARPVVARRLLASFEAARFTAAGAPFAHLRHPAAQARADAGLMLPPLASRGAGTIRGFAGAGMTDTVEVAAAGGAAERMPIGLAFGSGEDASQTTTWIVDGATGRPYPRGYAPSEGGWLNGAPVTIARYASGDGVNARLLIVQSSATGR